MSSQTTPLAAKTAPVRDTTRRWSAPLGRGLHAGFGVIAVAGGHRIDIRSPLRFTRETRPSPRRPAHPGRRSRAHLAGSCRTGRCGRPSPGRARPCRRRVTMEPTTVANTAMSAAVTCVGSHDCVGEGSRLVRVTDQRSRVARKCRADLLYFFFGSGAGGCAGSGIGNGSVSFSLLSLPSNSAVAAAPTSSCRWPDCRRGSPGSSRRISASFAAGIGLRLSDGGVRFAEVVGRLVGNHHQRRRTGTASPSGREDGDEGEVARGSRVSVIGSRPFASLTDHPITCQVSRSRTRSSRSAARRGSGSAERAGSPTSPTQAPRRTGRPARRRPASGSGSCPDAATGIICQ